MISIPFEKYFSKQKKPMSFKKRFKLIESERGILVIFGFFLYYNIDDNIVRVKLCKDYPDD